MPPSILLRVCLMLTQTRGLPPILLLRPALLLQPITYCAVAILLNRTLTAADLLMRGRVGRVNTAARPSPTVLPRCLRRHLLYPLLAPSCALYTLTTPARRYFQSHVLTAMLTASMVRKTVDTTLAILQASVLRPTMILLVTHRRLTASLHL